MFLSLPPSLSQSPVRPSFFSVKRRFNDFKWLCKKFDAGKKKYPRLPAAGAGTHMLSLLGSSKSASDEHAFRATELPKWVNTVLNAPDTREDPYLKIFVAGDSELLAVRLLRHHFGPFSRISQIHATTQHTSCSMICYVPMLIGCWFVLVT